MTDREVSMGCVVAYGLWTGALVLIALGGVVDHAFLGQFGVTVSIAAGTATVRQYFVAQNRLMRNAYELGRDSVTPMRR